MPNENESQAPRALDWEKVAADLDDTQKRLLTGGTREELSASLVIAALRFAIRAGLR